RRRGGGRPTPEGGYIGASVPRREDAPSSIPKRTGGAGGRRRPRGEIRISLRQTPDRARPRPNPPGPPGGERPAGPGLNRPSSVSHSMLLSRDYCPRGGPPHVTRRRAVVLSVLLAIGVGGAVAASERSRTDATYAAVAFYSEAMSIVHEHYVDQLPWATLVDNGIAGMVEALDADSDVLSPSQSRDSAPAGPGRRGDVGIVRGRRNGALAVIATRDGTSARAAGLLSGDAVLQVDGVSAEHLPPAGARARLRGQPGSQVVISIGRQG